MLFYVVLERAVKKQKHQHIIKVDVLINKKKVFTKKGYKI